MYRWIDPIAKGHPGPAVDDENKTTKSTKSKDAREKSPTGDMEEDFGEDVDEDWIIDDIGAAGASASLTAADGPSKSGKSYAREIGTCFILDVSVFLTALQYP